MADYPLATTSGENFTLRLDDTTLWTLIDDLAALDAPDAENLVFLTRSRRVVSVGAVKSYIETLSQEYSEIVLANIGDQIPQAISINPKGLHITDNTYFKNDLVTMTLNDGRTGSWVCIVDETTENPLGSNDWQTSSLPAPTAQSNAGYTEVELANEGGAYDVNLSFESRFIILRDHTGPTTLGFSQLASLGSAVVALRNPTSGSPSAITWPANVWWSESGPGTPPVLPETPGKGIVLLFRCWDGINVLAEVSQQEVAFAPPATPTYTPVADQKVAHLLTPGTTLLHNAVTQGVDHLSGNTGTSRTPYGIDFVKGQDVYTNGSFTSVGFGSNQAWTVGIVLLGFGAYLNGLAANDYVSPFGLAHPSNASMYLRPQFLKRTDGFLRGQIQTRHETVTGNKVGPANTWLRMDLTATDIDPGTMDILTFEYDGAGQYQMRNLRNDERLYDETGNAYATNTYAGDGTPGTLLDYSSGMRLSIAGTRRATSVFYPMDMSYRGSFAFQKVLNLQERKDLYNSFKDYIAQVDPGGAQLPALTY